MKTPAIITAMMLSALTLQAREGGADKKAATLYNAAATQPQFIENKGQITDQYGAARRDIDYKLSGGDVTLFVGNGQLHYQWSNKLANTKNEKLNPKALKNKKSPSGGLGVGVVNIYRMDVTLLGADKNAVAVAEDMQRYYENYYLPTTPDGATAHSYRKIIYRNVYPHIDWVLYTPAPPEGGSLATGGIKYDFIVHPGGNVADIQLQYDGATALKLEDGALVATTPMGSVTEDAPYCYMAGSKAAVASSYVLEGNILRYSTAPVPAGETLVIDPSLKWGTYLGIDFSNNNGLGMSICGGDTAGNVYVMGNIDWNAANIATTGAYQTSYSGGTSNGVFMKFDATGFPVWGSFYGGNNGALFYDGTTDAAGNIYMAGSTTSTTGIATTGAYQTAKMGGSANGFIVKFNNAGARQWATYYGDSSEIEAIAVNTAGEVYIAGQGSSVNFNYATTGAYATSPSSVFSSGFIAKLNAAGTARMWGTYYFWTGAICVDGSGNLYTGSDQGNIASTTGGSHQTTFGGGFKDGFISKFSNTGSRLWATYYGGSGDEYIYELDCDGNANVYVSGSTTSTNNIATTGSFLPSSTGGGAFIVKFNTAGVRQWGTYYASTTASCPIAMKGIDISDDGYLYVIGATTCSSGIVTPGAYKTTITNTVFEDACITIFNLNGQRQYATYYGGNGYDLMDGYAAKHIATSGHGKIYFGGFTPSFTGTGIATTGAYRTTTDPLLDDSFLAMFESDSNLYIPIPYTDTVVCSGDTLTVPYGVTQNFRSGNNFIVELSNASGSFASGVTTMGTVAAQTGGVYNYVVPHSTTQSNLYRVRVRSTAPLDTAYEEVNIRITTKPQSPTATNNGPVCSGTSLNLASSSTTAGVSYSWSGPGGYTSTTQNPVRNPALTKYSGDYIVTINNNGCISKDTTTAAVDSTPIAITAGNNGPLCVGSDLQLTASNTTAGATYNWSGPSFSNTTQNPTINNVGLANAGVYSVYASLGNCNTATATTTVSVVNGPSVNIYPSPNDSICGNTTGSATFVATAINPGGTPSYQWYKNGTLVTTTISNTYTATGIQTGDVFYTKLVPGTGAACNTAVNSNQITMTVMPYIAPSVSISVSPDSTVWSGVMLTFTATATNAGNNPKYQWKVNGVSMAGATSNVWGASNLNDKDKVTCEVTSSYICPQPQKVTSNTITLKVKAGINNLEANNISIYPNPTQTTLTVEGVGKGTMIQLKDVLGRQVIHTTATQTKTVLHTAQLTAGNYLLILTTADGEVMTEKVVKE
ncbi:MAG: T9SS type A sorting domain-containing protein [Chitinophagales bacterium]|nr:T9SS type A sorting domain-containing protein [Chitinophagales bacterium]